MLLAEGILSAGPRPGLARPGDGRGLLLAHQLSGGHCQTYPAITLATATPGKAVAFALPTLSGNRLIFPPLPDLRPGLADLRRWSSR
ncbi:hypothetical protein ABT061_32630 [Streptosporangium sp. NPDC002544]|uniref:hypothetical protein n=1 Tax=Streptosporangium sp. NPDC002544 TaxID=3154538 RepID=UPI00332837D0